MDMAFTQEEINALAEKSGLYDRYIENVDSLITSSNGLFDRLAASYIAASQIDIDLVSSVAISNLNDGMSATVYGIVYSDIEINTYTRKSGKEGKMLNLILNDSTGRISVVIWDEKIITSLMEGGVQKGTKIKIANGIVKENAYGRQISPGKWGAVIPEPDDFPTLEIKPDKTERITPIEDITIGSSFNIRGKVITVFELRDFTRRSGSTGHVLNFIIEDETTSIKIVLWDALAKEYYRLGEGERITLYNFTARQNRDIIELHSTYRSTIEVGTE